MHQRHAAVIGLKGSEVEKYKQLHAKIWPHVAEMISRCHLRNYSIFLRQFANGDYYLFSYFEYVGHNFNADMEQMAADPGTQEWWAVCHPCQLPLPDRCEGEWWVPLEEVFHLP